MYPPNVDISEARKQFNHVDELLREQPVITVTRHGKEAFALIDLEYLATLLETIEVICDPEAHATLQAGLRDMAEGRLTDHEDVKREML